MREKKEKKKQTKSNDRKVYLRLNQLQLDLHFTLDIKKC